MPCELKRSTKPGVHLQGSANRKVKLSVRASGESPEAVELDFVRYNGVTVTTDPAEITVAAGVKPLIVVLKGTVDGRIGHLVEDCPDGAEHKLIRFRFSALDPAKNYVLEGE